MTEKSKKTGKQKWSVIEFYEKSWHLVWEHKKLWILGFAAMIYAAGSSSGRVNMPNFGGNNSVPSKIETQEELQLPELSNIPESKEEDSEIYQEEVVANEFAGFVEKLEPMTNAFKSVPKQIYILLVSEIFILMLFSIILAFAASAWAEAALMKAVSQAHEEDRVELNKISQFAIGKIKSLLWVKYIPVLRFFILALLAILGSVIVFVILSSSLGDMRAIMATLAFIVGILTIFYLAFRLSIRLIYAKWHCVIDNLSGSKSFAAGINTATKNLRKTFWLIFTNMLVSMLSLIFFIVPIIVFLVLGFALVFVSGIINSFSIAKLLAISPLLTIGFLAMIIILSFIGAILQVFFSSVWYLAFKAVKK